MIAILFFVSQKIPAPISLVWTVQDLAMGLVAIPNMIALVLLFPQVRKQTKDFYFRKEFYPGK